MTDGADDRAPQVAGIWRDAVRRLRGSRAAIAAAAAIAILVALSFVGPHLTANRFDAIDWSCIAMPPGLEHEHWWGTDQLGRDLFVRTLQGTRISLAVGSLATVVSLLVGIVYGAVAGYAGGTTDHVMLRVIEILSGLPLIFFVILLTVVFGRSEYLLFAAIGAIGWLTMARIVRGQAMVIRRREFIEAATAAGAGPARILFRHVVPNVIGPVIVYAALTVPQIILFESFLSFLGLGIQEPQASLGTLIASGAAEMESAPWMLLIPSAVLAILLISFNVLGDELRDAFDIGEL
ncbi:MAG TPA: ABC transporter permease subunit [Steroidobacteraceae bacterium]|nr:ABC transporter permease subunit [Steroidobacteraceae bacterium]